jgi:pimeloyl-ACP methyl ester carboxylesterase
MIVYPIDITDYIIGPLVCMCVAVISCLIYIKLIVSSWIVIAIPPISQLVMKSTAVHMTKLVSHYGFREETHDISGVKIHCVVKDPVSANTDTSTDVFVFIHGTASASAAFFDTMKALPTNTKCVAIDLPTFGVSGHIDTERYPTNEKLCIAYADVIGHTLHQMEIVENTILVAHSLGGFLSIYVANRFPIKKLVLLNPAGILPTLGVYGYYWGMFFKAGLPTTVYQLPMISSELLTYLGRWWWTGDADNHNDPNIEFWLSFYANPANEGHRILQRLITLKPFYSYWNTPAISTLTDVYKKVPTSICFGVEDTIIPSHIGTFLRTLTQGEIRIHNIQNANHNPCTNTECMVKVLVDICNDTTTGTKLERSWRKKVRKNNKERNCLKGYSYPLLEKTQTSFQNVYDYIITNTNTNTNTTLA